MRKAGTMTIPPSQDGVKKGMTPREIKAELILRGITFKKIAKELGITSSAVSQTVYQYQRKGFRGFRVRKYIAQALNRNEEDIWPPDDMSI